MQKSFRRVLNHIRTKETDLPPWGGFLAVIMIAAYALAFFASLLFIASASEVPLDDPEPEVLAWANLMGGIVTLMLIFQYISTSLERADEEPRFAVFGKALKLNPSQNTPLWVVMMVAFIVAIAADTVGLVLNVPITTLPVPLSGLSMEITAPSVAALIVVVVMRPVVEELIFRGVVYGALLKRFSPVQSIWISAVLFAGFHYALDPAYFWWGFVQPMVLGLTAGAARAATKSTRSAIGVHVMFGVFLMMRAVFG